MFCVRFGLFFVEMFDLGVFSRVSYFEMRHTSNVLRLPSHLLIYIQTQNETNQKIKTLKINL